MKRILLLGSTGSIGTSACTCVRRFPDRFTITGIAANSSTDRLIEQAAEFKASHVCVGDPVSAQAVRDRFPAPVRFHQGTRGLEQIVEEAEYDILLNALVGAVGFRPTVAALRRGKQVALANKESLVIGGDYLRGVMTETGGSIIPVDSEHSAILQCICGQDRSAVQTLILTASGGPFRQLPAERFQHVRPEDALNHPTWSMGRKITIDAATLINKGFELIEAHHLFTVPYDSLKVWIHPQSIVHSLVEFHDGAMMAQMGLPSMEIPIQYALSCPDRLAVKGKRLNLAQIRSLEFYEPDTVRFPCLKLCIEAGEAGGSAPIVLNAANEIAVRQFLDGGLRFDLIPVLIEEMLRTRPMTRPDSVEEIEEIDATTRRLALARCERFIGNGPN